MGIWRKDTKPLVVGVSGISGSGKTTFVKQLCGQLDENYISVLPHDMYYLSKKNIKPDYKGRINYDIPSSLDTAMMIRHLKQLLKGKTIKRPIYDFKKQVRSKEKVTVEPSSIILVEGILIFAIQELRDLFNIKIFIDVPLDTALSWRILRDVKERGRQVENILEQYFDTVRESALENVIPTKYYSDIIIPRGGNNPVAMDFIISRLQEHIVKYV